MCRSKLEFSFFLEGNIIIMFKVSTAKWALIRPLLRRRRQEGYVYKFKWMTGNKSLLDFALVEEVEKKVLDINIFRGAGVGISNSYFWSSQNKMLKRLIGRDDRIEER